jgi:hypothetical protein
MEDILPLTLIVGIIVGVIVGAFSSKLAKVKGYDERLWFLGGLFFNIIALVSIAGLPVRDLEEIEEEKRKQRQYKLDQGYQQKR